VTNNRRAVRDLIFPTISLSDILLPVFLGVLLFGVGISVIVFYSGQTTSSVRTVAWGLCFIGSFLSVMGFGGLIRFLRS